MNDIFSQISNDIARAEQQPQRKADIPNELMELIRRSKLDLTKNIPDPQMLVSIGSLPVCTRGNILSS